MKKIALMLALVVGSLASYAQDATLPKWAQPKNEADKPVIERAIAQTDALTKELKLDDKQKLTVLEISVGLERRKAAVEAANPADKQARLDEIEAAKTKMIERQLTEKQLKTYKNGLENKENN